ncbi:MAG: hypothetical protein NTW10_09460 [Bacteroidetes bacterium]|nr:hypothetical protein [Bacteroidota bacterium]
MKKFIAILLVSLFIITISGKLFSQSSADMQEFGITTGTFSNFPANQNYLKDYYTAFYLAPYVRTGKHEFSAGFLYPLSNKGLLFTDNTILPRLGATAGYKYYIFNVFGRENLFVHYMFQYLRYKGNYDVNYSWSSQPYNWKETDMYINNVIGLGYNIFFDTEGRFGFFYTLDYVISQTSYQLGTQDYNSDNWNTQFVWNRLSTNIGFLFKLTSLKKKEKK